MSGQPPSSGGAGGGAAGLPVTPRRNASSSTAASSASGNQTEREDSNRASTHPHQHSMSTTPTQSQVGTLRAPAQQQQQQQQRESNVSFSSDQNDGTIGRGAPPRPSATPRAASARGVGMGRDPSSATRSTSYAPSDYDGISGMSDSQYSSGEEEGTGSVHMARSATLARGRSAGDTIGRAASRAGAAASLSRASTHQGTTRPAATRRESLARDSGRRSSLARAADDDDDDSGRRFGPLDDEDDEVEYHDRGEELVRRRMRARQQEKALRKKKEKAAERERLRQQQQQGGAAVPSGQSATGTPTSPRLRSGSLQGPSLDREGRPMHISIPTPTSEAPTSVLSPGLTTPGLSPGTVRTPATYPSPHSHIRRPSQQQGPQAQSAAGAQGRRLSGMSVVSSVTPHSATTVGARDPFSDAAIASEAGRPIDAASSVAGSVLADHEDEERDTVAGLATDAQQHEAEGDEEQEGDTTPSISGEDGDDSSDVEYTLKDRQDAINIEHPFGLPIWKPALYKKSRTVTRNAESALHSIPSAAAERHLLPGNLLWTILFGSWLSVICCAASLLLIVVPIGGARYGRVLWELGCYLIWPFGKYVEVDVGPDSGERGVSFAPADDAFDPEDSYENAFTPVAARFPHDHSHQVAFNSRPAAVLAHRSASGSEGIEGTLRPGDVRAATAAQQQAESSSSSGAASSGELSGKDGAQRSFGNQDNGNEASPLKGKSRASYGATDAGGRKEHRVDEELAVYDYVHDEAGRDVGRSTRIGGTLAFGVLFWLVVAPLMGIVCLMLWGMVFTIPMAKLTWVLLKNLASQPLALHFRSAPGVHSRLLPEGHGNQTDEDDDGKGTAPPPLEPGQFAPRSKLRKEGETTRRSKILLCTYRAMGLQYYKYTVGGVNILFINTLPFVFFTIFDFFFVESYVHRHHIKSGFLVNISSQGALFGFALGSVLPLSYFIGMAVASISAQSSIGMGAVINATFGSIVEIILYAIALTQGKARLVEGSLIGSILAGVLLMPGLSMCSGATRRKEQRFNARSAGVTSTMLIMAIIGILTPTLFYQIYGTFQLTCKGCPADSTPGDSWTCKRCFYEHVPPATDPFYQENVIGLMYTCTVILVLSYGIGLWFSLRTHASQIWQNPNPVPAHHSHPHHVGTHTGTLGNEATPAHLPGQRASLYKLLRPATVMQQLLPTQRPASQAHHGGTLRRSTSQAGHGHATDGQASSDMPALHLPESASGQLAEQEAEHVELLAHQAPQHANQAIPRSAMTNAPRHVSMHEEEDSGGHGGHDAPSWTRNQSMAVLLSCTVLYAIIAEILVDAVDVVIGGSGIDIKLLGITLFALVPNATEFMNAMSFAINGNIALSMEIGSAYALQVCLIQIPAMVAFSAWYNHRGAGTGLDADHIFSLIFPRWDVIAIIFAIFLLTYTYTEARSNYYRGSILILSYIVLISGFIFAPSSGDSENPGEDGEALVPTLLSTSFQTLGGSFGASPLGLEGLTRGSAGFGGLQHPALLPALGAYEWTKAMVGSLWAR